MGCGRTRCSRSRNRLRFPGAGGGSQHGLADRSAATDPTAASVRRDGRALWQREMDDLKRLFSRVYATTSALIPHTNDS